MLGEVSHQDGQDHEEGVPVLLCRRSSPLHTPNPPQRPLRGTLAVQKIAWGLGGKTSAFTNLWTNKTSPPHRPRFQSH